MTQKSVKRRTIQRMAFKGTITFFALKTYWRKNFKGKRYCAKVRWSSSLNQAVKSLVSQI
jgi:hypothetical protein